MFRSISAKKLLSEYNREQYRQFLINEAVHLSLVEPSAVPGIGASKRRVIFDKFISHPDSKHTVKLISHNDAPQALLWQTEASVLRKAVRYGVINTHALTSRVIGKLGEYRLITINRITKGMISNSYKIKEKLLDLYQDRFEALQEIECLINRDVGINKITKSIKNYIKKLQDLKDNLEISFQDIKEFDLQLCETLHSDLAADIKRATEYLGSLEKIHRVREATNAKGKNSLLQFIRKQMMFGLYELQGINQDLTFNQKRPFALTRGMLNDCIEDARKEIEDYRPHLCNAISPNHQGIFSQNATDLITYNFTEDGLSPQREREVLTAISFIEGWDRVIFNRDNQPQVCNGGEVEDLDVIHSTRWKVYRSFSVFLKSIGQYCFNIVSGIFFKTYPLEVETWQNKDFHLDSARLQQFASPNQPLWKKPFKFFTQIINVIKDLLYGVEDFRDDLVIRMPGEIINDWEATTPLSPLDDILKELSDDLILMHSKEESRLQKILAECGYAYQDRELPAQSKYACIDYPLNADEENDPLLSITKGINAFANIFLHNLFAKDPFGGCVFTTGYALGVAAIFKPAETASLLGSRYVNWISNLSYSMASSKEGAAIAGGSTQGQFFAAAWDTFLHGSSANTMKTLYKVGEDPLTVGAYISAAYSLGYVLTNGIAGHPIPWLGHHLKEDLGRVPELGYPFIGAKFAILLYEGLSSEIQEKNYLVLTIDPTLLNTDKQELTRLQLARWLCQHASDLPKMDPKKLFTLYRHLEIYFSEKDSKSLKKILYPEEQHSIAFQIFSNPLSYIPAILRVFIALVLSTIAKIQHRENSLAPIKRSLISLGDKLKKDGVKLLLFGGEILYLGYSFSASIIKLISFISAITIGRICSNLNFNLGHSFHHFFASVHLFFKSMGEYLFPFNVIKSVGVPHPNHTIQQIENSYTKLLKQAMSPLNRKAPLPGGSPLVPKEKDTADADIASSACVESETVSNYSNGLTL
ncbi:Uncharacterised protein (plasmid) [Legionella adelaidensis]|uniref:Uncharacterized protein n=1 Tax=Legionella adelaidensis TaxID=45056 RepID=A0A0W0R465_9GAMM|nr:hypothetical protein [Legionella adelaidensis]KTC65833.1 hypothetical protein Lade_0491 [Legionella adelaidensis]VEH85263.1 Uncharacterised protein [Legionella adelaidensis]